MEPIATLAFVAVLLIADGFAAVALFRSRSFVFSDIAIFVAPFIIWHMALATGIRPKSMSNLIEPLALVPIVMLAFLVRTYAFPDHSHRARSGVAAALCCVAAVVLYAFVPLLEE